MSERKKSLERIKAEREAIRDNDLEMFFKLASYAPDKLRFAEVDTAQLLDFLQTAFDARVGVLFGFNKSGMTLGLYVEGQKFQEPCSTVKQLSELLAEFTGRLQEYCDKKGFELTSQELL